MSHSNAHRDDEYPKREKFFAFKLTRLMAHVGAAQEISADGCWLVSVIALQEDATYYSKPVSYWNEQLMPLCGFGSRKRLVRARDLAVEHEWLHYRRGGKGVAGLYWAAIPGRYEHICRSEKERQTEFAVPNRNSKRNGKGTSSYPIPNKEKEATSEFVFVTKSGDWELPQDKLSEYVSAYSRVAVVEELRKARQWTRDNPSKRKTTRGMTRFLSNWLGNAKPTKDTAGPTPSIHELRETYRP